MDLDVLSTVNVVLAAVAKIRDFPREIEEQVGEANTIQIGCLPTYAPAVRHAHTLCVGVVVSVLRLADGRAPSEQREHHLVTLSPR